MGSCAAAHLNDVSDLQAVFTVLPVRFVLGLRRLAAALQAGSCTDAGVLGQALFDVVCVAIFFLAVLFLQSINAGGSPKRVQTLGVCSHKLNCILNRLKWQVTVM